ncbi:uncharacterized protein MICPUCDRAFT_65408 [Micromonas pusilla CCMP1545]|uniref:Predicted protein n=1 Tax=Micromonas pusilla (strain CCMP1545) TaxID=564608 RepID=C1MVL4_MICPC|nr:uncharacterized protein MICPUCDRAFT_65408 [Micromonas pusilla CCMP1545]EEH55725.1 predicted protein [Micromonas pusilla CCMP1545]|eukprot:XP_003059773.1 predicted protein [Micromonas pusilla CCMP1545]
MSSTSRLRSRPAAAVVFKPRGDAALAHGPVPQRDHRAVRRPVRGDRVCVERALVPPRRERGKTLSNHRRRAVSRRHRVRRGAAAAADARDRPRRRRQEVLRVQVHAHVERRGAGDPRPERQLRRHERRERGRFISIDSRRGSVHAHETGFKHGDETGAAAHAGPVRQMRQRYDAAAAGEFQRRRSRRARAGERRHRYRGFRAVHEREVVDHPRAPLSSSRRRRQRRLGRPRRRRHRRRRRRLLQRLLRPWALRLPLRARDDVHLPVAVAGVDDAPRRVPMKRCRGGVQRHQSKLKGIAVED